MGRHYSISEWVEAEVDGYADGDERDYDRAAYEFVSTKALDKARERFTREAVRVVERWMAENPGEAEELARSSDVESDDDIAYNTWAAIQGAGVGFWENMSAHEWASLEKEIKGDVKLRKAAATFEGEVLNAADRAVSRAIKESANPPQGGRNKSTVRALALGLTPGAPARKRR